MADKPATDRERAERSWSYTVPQIAEAAGIAYHQAKYARETNQFDPSDLRSVALFICQEQIVEMLHRAQKSARITGEGEKA